VARLVRQKAPEVFVRLCAMVAQRRGDAWFVLIGSGPLAAMVDREVDATGLAGRFRRVPVLASAASVMGQLDVFVLPSRFEGAPYTPLEAMRAGVPVVLSDVVGNRDVVEAGVSGEVRAFDDIAGLAGAVTDLLDAPAKRAAMVDAARARLRERFDVRVMGQAYERLYADVLGGR
jgi:glycosyltransferase involved in cell wall biosynthesis